MGRALPVINYVESPRKLNFLSQVIIEFLNKLVGWGPFFYKEFEFRDVAWANGFIYWHWIKSPIC